MKYLLLLKNQIENYPFFVEYGKFKELDAHLNLSDEVMIEGFFCKISEIIHDFDDNDCMVKLIVFDPQYVVNNKEEAIDRLKSEVDEMIEYGWYVNDYDLEDTKLNLK